MRLKLSTDERGEKHKKRAGKSWRGSHPLCFFSQQSWTVSAAAADGHKAWVAEPPDAKLEALLRLEAACQLAIDALPGLPSETANRLREPIRDLCDVTRQELIRIDPNLAKNFTRPAPG